ncbi:MAG: hypothetical protein VB111_09295 [Clostridiaceae bacterium]|nr:hypothetical protein [Clostridiaceae bacterium]
MNPLDCRMDDTFLSDAWIRQTDGLACLGPYLDITLAAAARVRENSVLRDYTVSLAAAMRDRESFMTTLKTLEFPRPEAGEPPLAYDFIPLLALLTQLASSVERMRARYIPEKVIDASLGNTAECLRVFQRRYLRPGMDMHYFAWSQGFIDARILRIGSLEFEACPRFGQPFVLPDRVILPDDPVISVHIPAGADISDAGRHAAYGEARTIFRACFPEYAFRGFACWSWLMDPQLCAMLPNSKIAAFQGEFIRLPNRWGGDAVFEYVFPAPFSSLDDLPENTTLERRVKTHYLDGKKIDEMCGIIPF